MRIIIKIGSSSLVHTDKSLNEQKIAELIDIIASLMAEKIEVLLVTSGAIAVGCNKLGLTAKPKAMSLKQACAALGQVSLMETYEKYAKEHQLLCAQILVNHDDFENRHRMINLSNTIHTLFQYHIIPIMNENDALAVEEIKVGDNDTLAALLVPMIEAELLILVSDIDGLYDKNPKEYSDATLIDYVGIIDSTIEQMVGGKISTVGTGGMMTKLKAARIAMASGCNMAIVNADHLDNILRLAKGEHVGTWFAKRQEKITSKAHWLIYNTYSKGKIVIDDGAKTAIVNGRKSLLPKGIMDIQGQFLAGSVVFIIDRNQQLLAKGIVKYSSDEIKLIKGKSTQEMESILEQCHSEVIIHANDLVILEGTNYGTIK